MYNLEHTSEYTEENQVCGHLQNGWNKCHHLQFKIFAGFRNAAKNTQNSVTYTSMMSSAGDWCTLRSLLAHGRHNTVRRPLHALQIVAAVTAFSFIPISSSFCSHPALQRSLSWQHNTWLEVFTLCENHSRGLNKYCAGIISFKYHQFSILKDNLTVDTRHVKVLKIFINIQGYIGDTMKYCKYQVAIITGIEECEIIWVKCFIDTQVEPRYAHNIGSKTFEFSEES